MDKPERVDVGQWWLPAGLSPVRVGWTDGWQCRDRFEEPSWGSPCEWLLSEERWRYLGSGDNPEPSEWMIETLARHAYAVDYGSDPAMYPSVAPRLKHDIANIIRCGPSGYDTKAAASVRSLYRILRDLGKW